MLTRTKKTAYGTTPANIENQVPHKRIAGGAWMAIALSTVFIGINQVLMVTLFSAY